MNSFDLSLICFFESQLCHFFNNSILGYKSQLNIKIRFGELTSSDDFRI